MSNSKTPFAQSIGSISIISYLAAFLAPSILTNTNQDKWGGNGSFLNPVIIPSLPPRRYCVLIRTRVPFFKMYGGALSGGSSKNASASLAFVIDVPCSFINLSSSVSAIKCVSKNLLSTMRFKNSTPYRGAKSSFFSKIRKTPKILISVNQSQSI
jgi:hypothetical protein